MKKFVSVVLIAILVMTVGAAVANAEPAFDGEIHFGVITGVTGPAALGGANATKGINLAVEQINAAGGVLGKKLVVDIEDDAGNPAGAVNAENKLIGDGVVGVIGPLMSTHVIAVEQIVRDSKVPSLVLGTSTKIYGLENPYIFRVRPADSIVANAAAKFLYDNLGMRKIGILTNTDDMGSGGRAVMTEYYEQMPDVELTIEGVNTGDKDLTGQIMKLKSAGVEGVIYWGHEAEVSLLARQASELGLDVPVLSSASLPQVLGTVTGEEIDGWYCAIDLSMSDESPAIQQYKNAFSEKYGEIPELHSSAYYGGVKLMADAVNRAGTTDGEAIRNALAATQGFQAVLGVFNCQENNDMLSGCVIIQYDSNKVETVVASVTVD